MQRHSVARGIGHGDGHLRVSNRNQTMEALGNFPRVVATGSVGQHRAGNYDHAGRPGLWTGSGGWALPRLFEFHFLPRGPVGYGRVRRHVESGLSANLETADEPVLEPIPAALRTIRVSDIAKQPMKVAGLKQLIIVAVMVIGAVLVTAFTSKVSTVSEAGIELKLPEEVGQWRGPELTPSELELSLLPKGTEFAKRAYTNDLGEAVYCSIVLSSPDPRSIHRPELCLPSQGVKITSSGLIHVPVKGLKKDLPVMKLTTRTTPPNHPEVNIRGYFLYWFVGKDRITAQHYQRILWNMWDRTVFNRNHRWAYIIVQGSVPESYLGPDKGKNDEQTL